MTPVDNGRIARLAHRHLLRDGFGLGNDGIFQLLGCHSLSIPKDLLIPCHCNSFFNCLITI